MSRHINQILIDFGSEHDTNYDNCDKIINL